LQQERIYGASGGRGGVDDLSVAIKLPLAGRYQVDGPISPGIEPQAIEVQGSPGVYLESFDIQDFAPPSSAPVVNDVYQRGVSAGAGYLQFGQVEVVVVAARGNAIIPPPDLQRLFAAAIPAAHH
jgi:hypothetical protein